MLKETGASLRSYLDTGVYGSVQGVLYCPSTRWTLDLTRGKYNLPVKREIWSM